MSNAAWNSIIHNQANASPPAIAIAATADGLYEFELLMPSKKTYKLFVANGIVLGHTQCS